MLRPIVYKKDEFDYRCNVIKDVSFLSSLDNLEVLKLFSCSDNMNLDLFFDGMVKLEELFISSNDYFINEKQINAIKAMFEEQGRKWDFGPSLREKIEKLREYRPKLKIEF